jgi:predicted transcriptional regulator with HTH domain
VIGALRGIETRYREEESLIGLNMVEERSGGKNVRLYGVTDFGKEIIQTMKVRR